MSFVQQLIAQIGSCNRATIPVCKPIKENTSAHWKNCWCMINTSKSYSSVWINSCKCIKFPIHAGPNNVYMLFFNRWRAPQGKLTEMRNHCCSVNIKGYDTNHHSNKICLCLSSVVTNKKKKINTMFFSCFLFVTLTSCNANYNITLWATPVFSVWFWIFAWIKNFIALKSLDWISFPDSMCENEQTR